MSMNLSRSADTQAGRNGKSTKELYSRCHSHVLSRIEEASTGVLPFYHTFIDHIFPDAFYDDFRAHMVSCKYSNTVQDRHQDNPAFMNRRYNLFQNADEIVECVRPVFSDPEVKQALLKKFYISPSRELADSLSIRRSGKLDEAVRAGACSVALRRRL